MSSQTLRVAAPAKINLTLEVTGLLEGGYHELDTVFSWLELGDEVVLQRSETTGLSIAGACEDVPSDPSNLAWRAQSALEELVGRPLPCHIKIEKRVPAAGGLGGGSADAAAVLWGLNRLYGLELSQADLNPVASKLGADVTFGLWGGCARGRGTGVELEWLPSPGRLPVVLLFPDFGCSTPMVYRAWDQDQPRPAAGFTRALVEALRLDTSTAELSRYLGNDLQPAAEQLFPRLVELRTAIEETGASCLLCGSGSTLAAVPAAGQDPQSTLRRLAKLGQVELTHLCPSRREWL